VRAAFQSQTDTWSRFVKSDGSLDSQKLQILSSGSELACSKSNRLGEWQSAIWDGFLCSVHLAIAQALTVCLNLLARITDSFGDLEMNRRMECTN
jgi:hypothetical protein